MPESVGTLVNKLEQLVFWPATPQETSMWSAIPSSKKWECIQKWRAKAGHFTCQAGKHRLPEDLEQFGVEPFHVCLLEIVLGNVLFLCGYFCNIFLFLRIEKHVNFWQTLVTQINIMRHIFLFFGWQTWCSICDAWSESLGRMQTMFVDSVTPLYHVLLSLS